MEKYQVLVIHGGNVFEDHSDYLKSLQDKRFTLDHLRGKGDWKTSLQKSLGKHFDVLMPRMPNAQNARYEEWKIIFENILPILNEDVTFVGHSLGAIFLAKWLSENIISKYVISTHLVAAAYNTCTCHPLADFIIERDLTKLIHQSGDLFLYHSKDDSVVPFSNFERYQQELPTAKVRIFTDRGHLNQPKFPELIQDLLE